MMPDGVDIRFLKKPLDLTASQSGLAQRKYHLSYGSIGSVTADKRFAALWTILAGRKLIRLLGSTSH
ncbi:MAG: hypothetical protein ACI82A_002876 [Candidatus Azotimanducaceae bacterium]|jgi:hypothetical protein